MINIYNKIPKNFQSYNIKKIESGASKKKIFRLQHQHNSFILTDFSLDKKEYKDYLRVYKILKDVNISIPKIIERNDDSFVLISEDFGDLRFDKIIKHNNIEEILNYAVQTLVVLKNTIKFSNQNKLKKYSYEIFKNEINELPDYYFPHIKIKNKEINREFLEIWDGAYKNINFNFENFTHKDFNINNLIFLPLKTGHLKCGIIDFQNAFWGESSWDLFSLLEDSRILFSDSYNYNFIRYFYNNIETNDSFEEFLNKYNFLNLSRQTRLLGRWIKLSKDLNQNFYLDFIPITLKRLKKSISLASDKKLTNFYNTHIFNL